MIKMDINEEIEMEDLKYKVKGLQEKNEELQVELEILKEQLTLTDAIHWVAIEEDMPEFNTWVIAHTKDGANHIAYFDEKRNEWVANSKFGDKVTHWLEEPKPPCL